MANSVFASISYIAAKHVGAARTVAPRVIVVHTPEWSELEGAARKVADYFATMEDGRKASAHLVVDNHEIIRCVPDDVIAYGAPGANFDGLHIELVGQARQTPEEWQDDYSRDTLRLGAKAVAEWCVEHGIPCVKLTDEQLAGGTRGIVGHDQVSRVYKKSDHTDPGIDFPWYDFLKFAADELAVRVNA